MRLRPGDKLSEGSPAVMGWAGEVPEPLAGVAPGAPHLDGLGEGQELVVVAGDPETREVVSLRIQVVAADAGGSSPGAHAAPPRSAAGPVASRAAILAAVVADVRVSSAARLAVATSIFSSLVPMSPVPAEAAFMDVPPYWLAPASRNHPITLSSLSTTFRE